MSKKDNKTGLSAEDAELWERVTKSISHTEQSQNVDFQTPDNSKPSESSENDTDNLSSETADFEELLNETPKVKTQKSQTTQAENSQKQTQKQTQVKNPNLTPNRADFAALLDNPDAVISTDEKQSKKTTPSFNPVINQEQSTKSTPKIETFNQRDARNISSGKQTIDAAIDLHGLTQVQAETALKTFLKRAHFDNKRTVLVITGKGQRRDYKERSFELGAPEPGVLKRTVPNWLDDMSDIIVSYTTSHSKHGGEGALYVRLRRFSKSSN